MDQPGKVVNPARGQLNRENEYFPVPVHACEFGLARRVRPPRLAPACSVFTLKLNLGLTRGIAPDFRDGVHSFIPPTAIDSVPSLSGHAIAFGWRSLPRVRQHRVSSPQGSSSNRYCLFRYHRGPNNARLSFPTPTIGMQWTCKIQNKYRRLCDMCVRTEGFFFLVCTCVPFPLPLAFLCLCFSLSLSFVVVVFLCFLLIFSVSSFFLPFFFSIYSVPLRNPWCTVLYYRTPYCTVLYCTVL